MGNDPVRVKYNEAVDAMAKGLYNVFPKAEFTSQTLRQMVQAREQGETFEKLPVPVRLSLVKLAMAMLPKPDVLAAQTEQEEGKKEEEKEKGEKEGKVTPLKPEVKR